MPASTEYKWYLIVPGATVGVYISGYPDNMATAFSAVVYPMLVEALYPQGNSKIDVTQTEVARHVDGTVARVAWVRNIAPVTYVAVDLNLLWDTF